MVIFYVAIFLISFVLTFLVRKIALQKAILDIPNDRSSHTIPTPRGGGLAIVIAWFGGIAWLYFAGGLERDLFFALLSGVPLVLTGILDDIISLKPGIRFLVQFISAVMALWFLGGLHQLNLGFIVVENPWILTALAIPGILWFINLFNFLDGIDGYAATEAIFVSAGMAVLAGVSFPLIIVFATFGFLLWNWQKAKIFMGDTGSTLLGFTLVILGIYYQNTGDLSLINWLIITSLFWFDATITLFRRWRNKEKLSEAHRKHAYQRIVQAGFSHQKTVLHGMGINLLLLILAFVASEFQVFLIPAFILSLGLLIIILSRVDNKKRFE